MAGKFFRIEHLRAALRPAALFPCLLLLVGAHLFFQHYRGALRGFFLREDSRYFSNGLFSFYDVFWAFQAPYNTMGHYRPITKLIWGLPEWLGIGEPFTYYLAAQLCLALACLFLMRLCWLLYGHGLLAVLCGALFALMPVNAKTMYWTSAGQNTTALLFVLAAIVFRFERWRNPRREKLFQWLSLGCFLLALCSREAGFVAGPMLLLVDHHFRANRRSWDVLLLGGIVFAYVFLLYPPFGLAKPSPSVWNLFSAEAPRKLWKYALTTPWSLGDSGALSYAPLLQAVSATALALVVIGPLLRRSLLFAAAFTALGLLPYLTLDGFSVEYAFLFGAGELLLACGALSLLLGRWRRWWVDAPLLALSAGLLLSYVDYLAPGRSLFESTYTARSLMLRDFLGELAEFSRKAEPYRALEITSFGPYAGSDARDTHHFIPLGIQKLIPDRTILLKPEVLNAGEGTGILDPTTKVWREIYARLGAPLRFHYTDRGFTID